MTTNYYHKLLEESYEYLQHQQQICEQLYGLSEYEFWHFSGENDDLSFSSEGTPTLHTQCQVIGHWNSATATWTWAWGKNDLSKILTSSSTQVRSYGMSHGLDCLTTAQWEATEADCWQMTAIAANQTNATGAYRIPFREDEYLFTLITAIKWAKRA